MRGTSTKLRFARGSNLSQPYKKRDEKIISLFIWLGLVSGTRTFYEENKEEFKLLLPMLKELIA
jgi:hypothetical protein